MKTVRHKQAELPAIALERLAELKRLARQPEAGIDYTDAPALDSTIWASAVRNPFYRPNKTHATIRLDADVLAWLKAGGKGYQTRLNAILRRAMLDDLHEA